MNKYPYNYYNTYQKDTIGIIEVINFINENIVWILLAIAICLIIKLIFWSSIFSYIKETAIKQTDLQNDIRDLHNTILEIHNQSEEEQETDSK